MNQNQWLAELFAAIDRKDTEAFVGFLARDAQFRFGSQPVVSGSEQIAEAVDQFFASIAALSHRVDTIFEAENGIAVEGEVTYTRHDHSIVTLPFINVFGMTGKKIAIYRIYIEIGPLYSS